MHQRVVKRQPWQPVLKVRPAVQRTPDVFAPHRAAVEKGTDAAFDVLAKALQSVWRQIVLVGVHTPCIRIVSVRWIL